MILQRSISLYEVTTEMSATSQDKL